MFKLASNFPSAGERAVNGKVRADYRQFYLASICASFLPSPKQPLPAPRSQPPSPPWLLPAASEVLPNQHHPIRNHDKTNKPLNLFTEGDTSCTGTEASEAFSCDFSLATSACCACTEAFNRSISTLEVDPAFAKPEYQTRQTLSSLYHRHIPSQTNLLSRMASISLSLSATLSCSFWHS